MSFLEKPFLQHPETLSRIKLGGYAQMGTFSVLKIYCLAQLVTHHMMKEHKGQFDCFSVGMDHRTGTSRPLPLLSQANDS